MKRTLSLALLLFPLSFAHADDALKDDPRYRMMRKLTTIQLPAMLEFDNVRAVVAFRWIELQSRQHDPLHEGIRIELEFANDAEMEPMPSDDEIMEMELSGKYTTDQQRKYGKTGVNLRSLPLLKAVQFTTAVTGLRYRIEPDRVVIFDPEDSSR